ncbi:relaxase/mobilization nuclease domain-containing protein [Niabella sp. CC-SYL272]|uniref:relaxase/mobilization nuclease domain-containing protein n=1 Tax=Niabella agricola TaxID=2891571 RepID=UPI001F4193AD|nr:relaxase/mobilization nuclease domain-containing protein [Niabella agricola]MCF3109628.1 relaxase/mobilization nuclease domain-containing protein [Niabella agricola]
MVVRFVSGRSIKGAVNYNEEKVRLGKANLIHAEKYLDDPADLSFKDRLSRLEDLAALKERTKENCVHVSLNFDPTEQMSDEKMIRIARDYMQGIGFGDQPFLVYRHHDAAHVHCHIVSTNVISRDDKISLHNLVPNFSEPTRKKIEEKYGLIRAEGRGKEQERMLKPVDLEKAIYGKAETKKAISNVVRTIVREYKFSSLAELNAVLKEYNVAADRGEPDSPMFKNKGLVYSLLDKKGEKIGVPIKASAIYTTPTMKKLEERFDKNKEARKSYREPLKHVIDRILPSAKDRAAFQSLLAKENIKVVFRENESRVYGITFVDHRSKTVFNGSDLGKPYSAASIQARIGADPSAANREKAANETISKQALDTIDYKQGIGSTLGQLYAKGLRLQTGVNDNSDHFFIGHRKSKAENYARLTQKMEAYFRVNKVSPGLISQLNDWVKEQKTVVAPALFLSNAFTSFINVMLQKEREQQAFAMYVPKKKKRKPR